MAAFSVKTCPALGCKDPGRTFCVWLVPLCPPPSYNNEMTSAMRSHFRKCLMSLWKTINKSYVTVTLTNKCTLRLQRLDCPRCSVWAVSSRMYAWYFIVIYFILGFKVSCLNAERQGASSVTQCDWGGGCHFNDVIAGLKETSHVVHPVTGSMQNLNHLEQMSGDRAVSTGAERSMLQNATPVPKHFTQLRKMERNYPFTDQVLDFSWQHCFIFNLDDWKNS